MARHWHREDIKAEVRKRGSSLFGLARQAGLDPRTMTRSLTTRFPSYHAVIAAYLNVPVHEMWPQWYDRYGNLRGRTRPDARSRRFQHSIAAE
mgnify:CR=1 FL=1